MMTAADCHRLWRQLPVGNLDDIVGSGSFIVLAPHQDDESLGCGGLLAAGVSQGRMPWIAWLTDGAASHPNSNSHPPRLIRQLRTNEAIVAAASLGVPADHLVFLNQPDGGPIDLEAAQSTLLARIGQDARCTAILSPWRDDPHCDHAAAADLAATVASAMGIRHVSYPVWGWTLPDQAPVRNQPANGFRFPVSPYLPVKRRAIQAHQTQLGGIIADDPGGFRLPDALLALFGQPYETFLTP